MNAKRVWAGELLARKGSLGLLKGGKEDSFKQAALGLVVGICQFSQEGLGSTQRKGKHAYLCSRVEFHYPKRRVAGFTMGTACTMAAGDVPLEALFREFRDLTLI